MSGHWSLVVTAALVLLGAAGCVGPSKGSSARESGPTGSGTATVQIATPERKTIKRIVRQPGTIQAFEQTPIFAKIPGYVEEWCVDIGDRVKHGQLLAKLWVPEEVSKLKFKEEQVRQANKSLLLARAQVATAKALVQESEAGLARAEANSNFWKSQSLRFANLVRESVLDRQTQEEALNQSRSAEAALKEAHARITSSRALLQEKESARRRPGRTSERPGPTGNTRPTWWPTPACRPPMMGW